jgi:hypothetical protein
MDLCDGVGLVFCTHEHEQPSHLRHIRLADHGARDSLRLWCGGSRTDPVGHALVIYLQVAPGTPEVAQSTTTFRASRNVRALAHGLRLRGEMAPTSLAHKALAATRIHVRFDDLFALTMVTLYVYNSRHLPRPSSLMRKCYPSKAVASRKNVTVASGEGLCLV